MTITNADMTHDSGQENITGKGVLIGRAPGGEDITLAETDTGAWSFSAVGDRWVRAGVAPTLEEAFAAVNDHLRLRVAPGVTSSARKAASPSRGRNQAPRAAGGLL